MTGSGVLLLFLLVRAARRLRCRRRRVPAFGIAGGVAAVVLAGVTLPLATAGMAKNGLVATSPHVVIIGIDSLRADITGTGSASQTPHIDDYLAGAHRFTDTTTPLARTYGSWVSILTGRHPVATNARYNLMPRALVDDGVTLPDALQGRGYRTIYATDEVRFANIDQSFGFDQLVTPPIGASDFLLGYAGDMPLVNLIASTAARRLAVPGEPCQPRGARHLRTGGFRRPAGRRDHDRTPDVPDRAPDAVALALQLGGTRAADDSAAVPAGLSHGPSRKSIASSSRSWTCSRTRACSRMPSSSCCRITARRSAPSPTRCCARPAPAAKSGIRSGATARA